MAGFDNDVLYGINADYSNTLAGAGASTVGQLLTNAQLWIGSTSANAGGTHINVGTLTSPLGTMSIGYANPNITIDYNGTGVIKEGVVNLGMTITSNTTLTINAANGSALSATNPAYVTMQSYTNPGNLVTYTITANQSCTVSNVGASTFGITNGVAYVDQFPMFVYAVGNSQASSNPETIITFMISRFPNTNTSPASGKIGKTGSIVANSQGSFFALNSSITVADYASSPSLCIGSFRCTRSSGNALSFTSLALSDGIGNFNNNITFKIDNTPGQFGAASGAFFYANGGTAPTFVTNNISYIVDRNNVMQLGFNFVNSTAGSGSGSLYLALPYILGSTGNGSGVIYNGTDYFPAIMSIYAAGTGNQDYFFYTTTSATGLLTTGNVGSNSSFFIIGNVGTYNQISFT